MAKLIKLTPSKTYATIKNLEKAVSKFNDNYRYLILTNEDGRFYPVFIGFDCFDVVHSGFCVAAS